SDTRPENDVSAGVYRVIGPARGAVIEGVEGDGDELARTLEASGLGVDLRSSVPDEEALLSYDAGVLVNYPRPSDAEGTALAACVGHPGSGLVVVGGDRAGGVSDYHQSAIEAARPVSSTPDARVRRQPVAEVLVIDPSGSMGAWHCRNGTI